MGFSPPPQPQAAPLPPPLPPAAIPPTMANAAVGAAGANQKDAAALAAGKGMGGTLATGPQGDLVPASTGKANLLGELGKTPIGSVMDTAQRNKLLEQMS